MTKIWLAIALALLGVLSASSVMANPGDTPWTGTTLTYGPDTIVTTTADGTTGAAEFSYKVNVNPDDNWMTAASGFGSWEFSTVAGSTRTVSLDYGYAGYHAYYLAAVSLEAFVDDGTTVSTTPLVNASSYGAFDHSGTVALAVTAGDTYGFRFAGSNGDSDGRLFGTLTVDEAAPAPTDTDGDGVADDVDNCPAVPNASQADTDNDGIGDACEADTDADGVIDDTDNCPSIANADQADADNDGIGDVCEADTDADGVIDDTDNCPSIANADQADSDSDGTGNACELDSDSDGTNDDDDNCPAVYNPHQLDPDYDGVGNACDADIDGDGIPNAIDRSWNGSTWVDAQFTYSNTVKDADSSAATIVNTGHSLSGTVSGYYYGQGKAFYLANAAGATEQGWAALEAKARGRITNIWDLEDCDTCQTTPDGIGFTVAAGSIFLGMNKVEITSDNWQTVNANLGDGQHWDGSSDCDSGPCADKYPDWPMHPHNLGCNYDNDGVVGFDYQNTSIGVQPTGGVSFSITCGSEMTTVEDGSLEYSVTIGGNEIVFTVTAGENDAAVLYADFDVDGNLVVENLSGGDAPAITFTINGFDGGSLDSPDATLEINADGVVVGGTGVTLTDTDEDGVYDYADNCVDEDNADQADLDNDGIGDACDPDVDGDGYDSVANGGTDCNDVDGAINPDATEVSDGVDNNCDGILTKGDVLIASGVDTKGIRNSPGLLEPFNPKSAAAGKAGKK